MTHEFYVTSSGLHDVVAGINLLTEFGTILNCPKRQLFLTTEHEVSAYRTAYTESTTARAGKSA